MRKQYHIEQNTQEWLEARIGKPTSSNFATIMANSPNVFGNPAHVYAMQIALESTTGEMIDMFSNQYMEHGLEYEPIARERYQEDQMVDVEPGGFFTMGGVGSSPDGLINSKGLIEIKCPKWNTHFKLLAKGGYNTSYRWQIQGQLWITGREWCDFVSYCEDFPKPKQIYIHRVTANKDDQKALAERLGKFMQLVKEYQQVLTK